MEFTTLGRTELNVSVASLGCGGGSALGKSSGKPEEHSINVVRKAMDLGVNPTPMAPKPLSVRQLKMYHVIRSLFRQNITLRGKEEFIRLKMLWLG